MILNGFHTPISLISKQSYNTFIVFPLQYSNKLCKIQRSVYHGFRKTKTNDVFSLKQKNCIKCQAEFLCLIVQHKTFQYMIKNFQCHIINNFQADIRFPMTSNHDLACNYVRNRITYGYQIDIFNTKRENQTLLFSNTSKL